MEMSVEFNKKRKTVLKASLTRFISNINKFQEGDNLIPIKTKLMNQDRDAEEFKRVLTIIICATESQEDQDALYQEGDDYTEAYTQVRNHTLILLGYPPDEPHISSQQCHQFKQSNSTTEVINDKKYTHLQPIALPKFDGRLNMWPEFADLFKFLVIDNKSMTNIEKLMHLKSCLLSEAATVLANITSRENNFNLAWNILKNQYDNPKLLIETHVKALFALPKISSENANSLREHLSKFNSHCQILKAAQGLTVDNLLTQFSITKYDEITREKWEEFAYDMKEPKFDDVVNFLTQRNHIKAAASTIVSQSSAYKREHRQQFNKSYMTINTSNSSSTKSEYSGQKCNYCTESHRIYDCPAFIKLSPSARYEAVQTKKMCNNCLGTRHFLKNFNSKRSCFKCHKRHNTLIHDHITLS